MTNRKVTDENKIKHGERTDWNRVIGQSDTQVERKSKEDPDSPVLENKKYYKPGKKH